MDTNIIIIIIVVIILLIVFSIFMFKKSDDSSNKPAKIIPKFSFTVKSSDGEEGKLSPDGKSIVWSSGTVYKRLAPVGSDPTNLNDNYVAFPIRNPPLPPTGAPGDNVVNWINNDVWPIKLITLKDGSYAVYQNGGNSNIISNFK